MTDSLQTSTPKIQWLTDYDLVAAILAHKAFAEVTFKGLVPLLGHVIVTMEGEVHRQRRSLEGRLFVSSLLKSQEESLIPGIIKDTLLPYLAARQGCLVEISHTVTSRIAAKIIGLDGLEDPEAAHEVVYLLSALVGGTNSAHGEQPPLTRRQARNLLRQRYLDRSLERRRQFVKEYHEQRRPRSELPLDLITLLLLHRDQWTLPQISAEAAFYAVAAIDTTATLVPHLMHELWQFGKLHPEYIAQFQDLKFLRAAAAEALRLHPVLPTLFRKATQAVEIGEHRFEPDEVVGLYLGKANREESVFGPDAREFNPFRSVRPRTRRAGLSFGGGAHLCMGRELALGTPDADDDHELFGEAALLAQALFKKGAIPDPTFTVPPLSPYQRDIYTTYPLLFEG